MNKKTIERLRQQKEAREKQHRAPHTPPPTSDGTPAIPPLPSCGEDSAFSPLQSPPDAGFTIDSQSPSSFNLDSFSFQDTILPESGLGCMEDWLPTIPGGTIESVQCSITKFVLFMRLIALVANRVAFHYMVG